MSIFSDYECGAMSREEYKSECSRMNRQDRYEREHEYDEFDDDELDEEGRGMTREEELDWLCRLRSEIYVYMPKEWLIPMNNALDMAISALFAEGEYVKKEDILNELGDTNMDILTDEVKEIVNGLQTYTFPDSAEDNTMEWISARVGKLFLSNDYKCSKCGNILNFDGVNCGRGDANFCPNCGRKAVKI